MGPSRQGKSTLCSIVASRPGAFAESSDPMNAQTHGAWAIACADAPHTIVDTEGLSHDITRSSKGTPNVMYAVSTTVIISTKEPGADAVICQLKEWVANMGDLGKAQASRKPRGILVLRDADDFGFTMVDGKYTDSNGKTFDEVVREKLVGHQPLLDRLFSSFHAFALPNLRKLSPEEASQAGDMPLLKQKLVDDHPGALVKLTDHTAMEGLVSNINERDTFDAATYALRLTDKFAGARVDSEDVQSRMASKFDWDSNRLWDDYRGEAADIVSCFPDLQGNKQLQALEKAVLKLAHRMKNRTEVRVVDAGVPPHNIVVGGVVGAYVAAGVALTGGVVLLGPVFIIAGMGALFGCAVPCVMYSPKAPTITWALGTPPNDDTMLKWRAEMGRQPGSARSSSQGDALPDLRRLHPGEECRAADMPRSKQELVDDHPGALEDMADPTAMEGHGGPFDATTDALRQMGHVAGALDDSEDVQEGLASQYGWDFSKLLCAYDCLRARVQESCPELRSEEQLEGLEDGVVRFAYRMKHQREAQVLVDTAARKLQFNARGLLRKIFAGAALGWLCLAAVAAVGGGALLLPLGLTGAEGAAVGATLGGVLAATSSLKEAPVKANVTKRVLGEAPDAERLREWRQELGRQPGSVRA